jgi:deoxyribose-phosphate aldolase
MDIARMIDHAALHPSLTDDELRAECLVALQYGTASICIKPYAVKMAASILAGSAVKVCTVVGFPHGSSSIDAKWAETMAAIENGAAEIDAVINIGKANSFDWTYITEEINAITELCHSKNAIVKFIFENTYLAGDAVKIKLCEICSAEKADFVKTSTGFDYTQLPSGALGTMGAQDSDIALMRANTAPHIQIKASGGIRSLADIHRLHTLGATRFGTSSTVRILSSVI